MRERIFDPLRANIQGSFPDWILPEELNVEGCDIPLESLQEVFQVDWKRLGGYTSAVLENLQVEKWNVKFFTDEPDPTPLLWPDRPRLDIVITFADQSWVRYHPSGDLIWSTEAMPTRAMTNRINRRKKLIAILEKRQR